MKMVVLTLMMEHAQTNQNQRFLVLPNKNSSIDNDNLPERDYSMKNN